VDSRSDATNLIRARPVQEGMHGSPGIDTSTTDVVLQLSLKKILTRTSQDTPRLTALQLEVLKVLWRRPAATVGEIPQGVGATRPLAQTTIATLLSRLAKRGLVAYRTEGRQYIYRAVLQERDARRHALIESTKGLVVCDVTD